MARAFDDLSHRTWVWHALKLLNQARNELSHNLIKEEFTIKLEAFVKYVSAQNPELFKAGANEKFTEFHMAAVITYLVLAAHVNRDPTKVRTPTLLTGYNA